MSLIYKTLQILCLIFLLTGISGASSADLKVLCSRVEKSVNTTIPFLKLKNKIVFNKSCMFWWQTKQKDNIELYLYTLDTEKESKEKLEETTRFLSEGWGEETEKLEFGKYDSFGVWNDGYFYEGSKSNSSILLLRKDTIVVNILAVDPETVNLLEKSLRTSIFSGKKGL